MKLTRKTRTDVIQITSKHWSVILSNGEVDVYPLGKGGDPIHTRRLTVQMSDLPDLVEILVEVQNTPERS